MTSLVFFLEEKSEEISKGLSFFWVGYVTNVIYIS